MQWAALTLLCGACMLVRTDNKFLQEGRYAEGAFNPGWGWLLVLLQAFISAAVGVMNEHLYKSQAFKVRGALGVV